MSDRTARLDELLREEISAIIIRRVCKELRVDLAIVEARHRADVETQGARRQHQICPLQRAVPECRHADEFRFANEPALGVGMRKQLRQALIERHVMADDGHHRRTHRLVHVAGR